MNFSVRGPKITCLWGRSRSAHELGGGQKDLEAKEKLVEKAGRAFVFVNEGYRGTPLLWGDGAWAIKLSASRSRKWRRIQSRQCHMSNSRSNPVSVRFFA